MCNLCFMNILNRLHYIIINNMDLDEIKCALCSQLYNEHDRMPILLPDCGHSFCFACIQACFEILRHDQATRDKELIPECDCKKEAQCRRVVVEPTPFLKVEDNDF